MKVIVASRNMNGTRACGEFWGPDPKTVEMDEATYKALTTPERRGLLMVHVLDKSEKPKAEKAKE